jgi:endonuclease/exonuclease/phosphatase family metal-dependent hydrolase
MQSPRALTLLLVVLLAACSSPPPVTPPGPLTDAGTEPPDSGTSLVIHTTELQATLVSRPYRAFLTASGGTPAYSWHLVEGTLPPGLALSSLGEIHGTPSAHGSFTFHLEVRDSAGHTARRSLTLEVIGVGPIITPIDYPDVYLGSGYTLWTLVSSGTPPYIWTLASGTLPPGLRLSANGSISGAPVATGPFAFTLRVQDATGLSAQHDFTLSVLAPPALTTPTLPPGVTGVPYSATLSATGGKAPLTFHLVSGTLPPGLRLENGAVLGTPTTPDTAALTVEVRDANGRTATASLPLAIRAGLTVTPTSLPDAYTDTPYGHGLSAAGGQPPYTWALTSGRLPEGLSLSTSGAFSGTSSAAGTSSFTVRVTDSEGTTDARQVSLVTYTPPTLAAVPPQSAYAGDNVVLTLSASLGKAPFTFTATGGLPPGLALDTAGLLHGRPTGAGAFGFDLTARDANRRASTRSVSFTVHALPTVTTSALPNATLGAPYSVRLSASGGRGTLSWTHASGPLPPGLSLTSDGTLSGTPSAPGTSVFTALVTDAGGRTDSRTLSLAVFETPTLQTSTLTDGYVGTAYSFRLAVSGGRTPLSGSIDSGALPPGLSLDSSTGIISGTPSAAGTASFTVRVTDSDGRTSTRALSLTVYRPPSVSGPPLPFEAYVSEPFTARYTATDGKPPYVFYTPDALPPGLTLSSSGTLSGTPSATGSLSGQVRVIDANERTGSSAFAFNIHRLPAITTTSLPEARGGTPYSTQLLASGGKPGLTWSIATGALPSGLGLSTSGTLSGTPTGGTTSFTARVSDANGRLAERPFTLSVQLPLTVTTASLPDAVVARPYSATLTASGGRAPLSWSHSGALPTGLSLSSAGVLSGTPGAAGTRAFTVSVRDADGLTDSRALSLTVNATGTPLTVGHWNIEWFGAENQGPPRSTSDGGTPDDLQIAHARDILGDAGVNVWGLVEMVDSSDFAFLRAQLPGYSGFLANDVSFVPGGNFWYGPGEQKPGILYDSTLTFRSAQLILTSDAVDFGGRPPLRVDFTLRAGSTDVPLSVIVLHMKAFEDERSYGMRQRAGAALKHYLDTVLPSERVLVIGDWNDDLDQSITRDDGGTPLATPFEPLLLDTQDYTFITLPLSLGGERTTVSFRDAIDHTLASNEVATEYVSNSVRVLRPDLSIPNYGNTVSDHYPVVSRYDIGGPGAGAPATPPHLFINELLANEPVPDGGSEGDTDFEFIEVLNAGASPADLTGWSLWDSMGERHVFASGTTLAPGQAFVVFGGPRGFPAGTPNTVAASSGQLALNNGSDTASLRAPDGGTVDSWPWLSTVDNVSINRSPDAVPDAGFVHHTQLSPGLGSSPGRRADGGTF